MRWQRYDLWKAGIVVTGVLFLILIAVLVSTVAAHEGVSGSATLATVTVQATPTVDATVIALSKEKLAQEVQQLKNQNDPGPFGWLQTNASILLSTLVVVIGGLIGLFRWFGDRQGEREKRTEERFQSIVEGLGDEKEGRRVGAAIMLRTFLRPGYEQFYSQAFDLAVAHLRLPRTSKLPEEENIPLPLTTLGQALIVVFKEAFPLARNENERSRQALDATGIQLDNSFLEDADLKRVWMPRASLREANLWGADLSGAILWRANLSGAKLRHTNLSDADLWKVNFSGAELKDANLSNANLRKTNLEDALTLKNTDLRGVTGLTKEQLEACKVKGAIIDEATMADTSQTSSASSQGNDAQPTSASPAQVSTPPSSTGGSSSTSSQPGEVPKKE